MKRYDVLQAVGGLVLVIAALRVNLTLGLAVLGVLLIAAGVVGESD